MSATPTETPTPPARRSPLKLVINIAVGLAFSALFIWLATRNVAWDEFMAGARQLKLWPVVVYGLILSLTHALRMLRWGLTLRPMAPIPWSRIVAVGAVGMMAIFALPARLGELVRPLLISEDKRVTVGQATATIVVERLADGLCVSLMLFVTVLLLDPDQVAPEYIYSGAAAASVFGGASLALLMSGLLYRWIERPLTSLLGRVSPTLADRVLGTIEGFFMALKLISSPRTAIPYILCTAAIWAVTGIGTAILFSAFPAPLNELGLLAGFAVLSVLVVGIMIPAGPGTVGVFHWAVVFGLGMFLIPESQAFLFGTLLHLMIALINIGYGTLAWIVGDVRPGAVWRRRAGASEEVAP